MLEAGRPKLMVAWASHGCCRAPERDGTDNHRFSALFCGGDRGGVSKVEGFCGATTLCCRFGFRNEIFGDLLTIMPRPSEVCTHGSFLLYLTYI